MAENQLEITNLIHQNLVFMDQNKSTEFQDLFSDTAVIIVKIMNRQFIGKEGAKEFLEMVKSKVGPESSHWESNIILNFESASPNDSPKTASNFSYWQALNKGNVTATGTHEDSFEKIEGKWKFTKRIITHTWKKA